MQSIREQYDVVIGIEVHVQLSTASKIFCSCSTTLSEQPNSNLCPICAGYPGVLPVLNEKVIEYAVRAGLGTHANITLRSEFDRKHYFYPDLPKGYQITQQRLPICTEGFVQIRLADGSNKKIRLTRIHIEEDAGKSMHAGTESFVDLNRAGTPLLEIVSEPDITSSFEAKAYLKELRSIVQYLGICTGNMEDGAFRADTNISVKKKGATKLGTKVELKNINSRKFIGDAIEYEVDRQIELVESGQLVKQETRLWDTKNHKTFVMRSKEEAADYRYMREPDLPPIYLTQEEIDAVKQELPQLPEELFEILCTKYNLTPYEADIVIEDQHLARYTLAALEVHGSKTIINWILRDLIEYLKNANIPVSECFITPDRLSALVKLVESNAINNQAAKQIFAIMTKDTRSPADIMKEEGLEQMGNADELEQLVLTILQANPQELERLKGGDMKLMGFFIGEIMKQSKGKANPKMVQDILKKKL